MRALARNSNDNRVITQPRIDTAPGWYVSYGIGKANAYAICFGGLPAVSAATHPMVGIANSHTAYAVLFGQCNSPFHAVFGVEHPGCHITVPLFYQTKVVL